MRKRAGLAGLPGKWDVVILAPDGSKFKSRGELRAFLEEQGAGLEAEAFDFTLGGLRRQGKVTARRRKLMEKKKVEKVE